MNDEMKIIDLYELIANKEYDKLPRKIRVRDCIYDLEIDEEFINYKPQNGDWLLNQFLWKLNEKIEILEILEEEKQIPEKLKDILKVDDLIPPVDENMYKIWQQTIKNQNKINEICDYLKSKGE